MPAKPRNLDDIKALERQRRRVDTMILKVELKLESGGGRPDTIFVTDLNDARVCLIGPATPEGVSLAAESLAPQIAIGVAQLRFKALEAEQEHDAQEG